MFTVLTFPNVLFITPQLILTTAQQDILPISLLPQFTVSLTAEVLRDSPEVSQEEVSHSGSRAESPDISGGDCVAWWKVPMDGG